MKVVSMHEAKTHLSRYVDVALRGEEVVIARRKQALVRLVPVEEPAAKRSVGTLPGLVLKMGGGFDEPVDWDIAGDSTIG